SKRSLEDSKIVETKDQSTSTEDLSVLEDRLFDKKAEILRLNEDEAVRKLDEVISSYSDSDSGYNESLEGSSDISSINGSDANDLVSKIVSQSNSIVSETMRNIMKEKNEFEKHQAAKKYYDAGQALALRGRYEEAIKEYNKAIKLKPDEDVLYYKKGNSLAFLGRYEEAIECYDKSISLNPEYADAYNNKGNSFFDLEKYEEALVEYDKAIELKPNDA
ncbi:tetratricopeptide repeat protein, tpr, putative, partial [Ixodes scapularis]